MMRLAYLYTPSELTPWKENVSAESLRYLQEQTSEKFLSEVICFTGFNDSMKSDLMEFDMVFNLCYGYMDYD